MAANGPPAEGERREPLAHAAVSGGARVEPVGQRQLGGVGLAVQGEAVEVGQRRILARPLLHDPGKLLPYDAQVQLPEGDLRRVSQGRELHLPVTDVRGGRSGGGLLGRAEDGRDHQERRGRVPLADGVEEPVHGRPEGAQPHQVQVHDIDADLDADQVGGGVPQGARGERIEQGAAAQTQVDQLHAPRGGGQGGPRGGGAVRGGPLADRTAMVQPHPPPARLHRRDGGVGAQGDQLGDLGVRQPDLDGLLPPGQPVEPYGADPPWERLLGAVTQVHHQHIAPARRGPPGRLPVDVQVVRPVRAGGNTPVGHDRTQDVQLDGGGPGAEHQPYAGGLGLGLGHLFVTAELRPGAGGQPVGEEAAARGALQVECAAHEGAGEGGGERGGEPAGGWSMHPACPPKPRSSRRRDS